ncbi:hypothetical protein DFJ74DRAFT_688121 [Hyaloraphidium curvatum]|nr:hypothetical protein DFJ74DRAFT_688121 [Hyaloraphidium curvatum]
MAATHDGTIAAHAVLCAVGTALLLPSIMFTARYGRHFLSDRAQRWGLHAGLGALALAMLAIGCGLGYVHRFGQPHWIATHGIIGLVVPVVLGVQYLLGFVIYHLYDPARTSRPWRNQVHRILGPAIAALAIADCVLGFVRWGTILPASSSTAMVSCWVFLAVSVGAFVAFIAAGEHIKTRDMERKAAAQVAADIAAADVKEKGGKEMEEGGKALPDGDGERTEGTTTPPAEEEGTLWGSDSDRSENGDAGA